MRNMQVKVVTVQVVLADQVGRIRLLDRSLEPLSLAHEFAPTIDIRGVRADRETCQQATLDEQMRIMAQDFAVLAGPRLGLVGMTTR